MIYDALIFCPRITPRLNYINDFLSRYYNVSFGVTSEEARYIHATEKLLINYSCQRLLSKELFIYSHELLFDSSIEAVAVECFEKTTRNAQFGSCKAFFRTDGDIEFDVLAAIFYLLSRYEEYLPHQKDSYNRFDHTASLAYKNDFLHLPIINFWLEDLRFLLAAKNPCFLSNKNVFSFLPTYDIDMAWSFSHKGIQRNAGGLLLSLARLRFRKFLFRIKVLQGKSSDPFDAYSWMDHLHHSFKMKPIYFFLVAGNRSRYDKNINVRSKAFQQLVKKTAGAYEIGLHPSWASGDQKDLISMEKKTLERLTQQSIHKSRAHYIRLEFPFTYRCLIDAGIIHDYSMGYGSINGFRASVTTPFFWYDLVKEETTNLVIYPFCFMDANAYYEQQYDPEEALEEMLRYYHIVRSVNGNMITIWHNSFLGTGKAFRGWREVYEQFVATLLTAI